MIPAFRDGKRIEVVVPWYDSFSFTGPGKKLELHRLVIDMDKKTLTDEPHKVDGFVFSFVHDISQGQGLFVILDGRHLSAAPLAAVRLRRRIPAGLHGSWSPVP